MWKPGKQDDRAPAVPSPSTLQGNSITPTPKETRPVDTPKFNDPRTELAHIGKSVVIKGELSGSEDLYLDGEVEGTIELRGNSLTIGPNGRIRANTQAKDIVVHGKVNGNMKADRIELKKSALVTGDLATQRVVIEDGAFFKGGIDIQREPAKEAPKPEVRAAAAAASAA
ncbi:MAG: bactofilin family protein, partial [Terriglobales bacterium]